MAVSPAGLTMRSSKSGAGLPTSGGAYCDQHGRPRIYGLPPRQQEQELCLLAPAARGCARPFAARSRSRKDPGQRERARTARQAAACQRRVRPSCRRPRAGAAGALGRWRRAWLQGRGRALQPPLCAPPSLQAVLPRTGRPAAVPASPSRLPGPRRPSPLFSHFLPGVLTGVRHELVPWRRARHAWASRSRPLWGRRASGVSSAGGGRPRCRTGERCLGPAPRLPPLSRCLESRMRPAAAARGGADAVARPAATACDGRDVRWIGATPEAAARRGAGGMFPPRVLPVPQEPGRSVHRSARLRRPLRDRQMRSRRDRAERRVCTCMGGGQ